MLQEKFSYNSLYAQRGGYLFLFLSLKTRLCSATGKWGTAHKDCLFGRHFQSLTSIKDPYQELTCEFIKNHLSALDDKIQQYFPLLPMEMTGYITVSSAMSHLSMHEQE